MPATRWTDAGRHRRKVRRRWDDGTLLRALATGEAAPCSTCRCAVRGRRDRRTLAEVREWIAAWKPAAGTVALRPGEYQGRRAALRPQRTSRPCVSRVLRAGVAVAGRLDGSSRHTVGARRMLDHLRPDAAVREWVAANPLRALACGRSGQASSPPTDGYGAPRLRRYLREITAPGVDTKFVERHRDLLASCSGSPRARRRSRQVWACSPASLRASGCAATRRCSACRARLSEVTFRARGGPRLAPARSRRR